MSFHKFQLTFQIMIYANGYANFTAEHSWGDAPAMAHLWEWVLAGDIQDRHYGSDGYISQEKVMKYEYDRKLNIDPLNYYGFGVVSYFQLLKMMTLIFLVLTLVHGPLMYLYSSQFSNYHHKE